MVELLFQYIYFLFKNNNKKNNIYLNLNKSFAAIKFILKNYKLYIKSIQFLSIHRISKNSTNLNKNRTCLIHV